MPAGKPKATGPDHDRDGDSRRGESDCGPWRRRVRDWVVKSAIDRTEERLPEKRESCREKRPDGDQLHEFFPLQRPWTARLPIGRGFPRGDFGEAKRECPPVQSEPVSSRCAQGLCVEQTWDRLSVLQNADQRAIPFIPREIFLQRKGLHSLGADRMEP